MHYNITKKITVKRQGSTSRFLTYFMAAVIVLIAIPVAVIALLSFVVLGVFSFLYAQFKQAAGAGQPGTPADSFYLERILLQNQYITITVIEDEADAALTDLNDQWSATVGNTEIYLYRARTTPHMPTLDGKPICFFLKEQPGGALLQITGTHPDPTFSTQLVYLDYQTLQLTPLEPIGPFYLYNDEKNPALIKGFNNGEELDLYLS